MSPSGFRPSVGTLDCCCPPCWLALCCSFLQDTPGYGDDLDINNHINMIVGYLNSRNEKWLEMESATDRAQDLSEVEDPRVDVCLFCVPPHRLRAIDIK